MTNAQIILKNSIQLMKDGALKPTTLMLTDEDGNKIPMPEAIHTFAKWKQLGYIVKKGEKAKAQFLIWKNTKYEKENEEGKKEEHERMFMKKASFFTIDQVEGIKK